MDTNTPNYDAPVLDFSSYEFKTGLDDGFYLCDVVDTSVSTANSGRLQIQFDLRFPNGAERNEWISVPLSADDAVMAIWKFAFESAGYSTEEIKGFGPLSINGIRAKFYQRQVRVEYKNGNKDLGKRMVVKLTSPYFFDRGVAAMKAAASGGPSKPVSSFGGGGNGGGSVSTVAPPVVVVETPTAPAFGGGNSGGGGGADALSALMNAGK